MKLRQLAAAIFAIIVTCVGVGRASAQQTAAAGGRPVIVLTDLASPPSDVVAAQLASSITQSIQLVMGMTGSLTVERADFLTPTYSFEHALEYYRQAKANGAVYGSVRPGKSGSYTVTLEVWNASSSKARPVVLRRTISNLLSSFSLADRIALDATSTVIGRKLSEGTLVVENTQILRHYSVYADGHLLGRERSSFELLTGKREIVVARPGGPLGDVPFEVFHVDIRNGKTTTVRLAETAPAAVSTTATASAASLASTTSPAAGVSLQPLSLRQQQVSRGRVTGSIRVDVRSPGFLYLDGVLHGHIGPDSPSLLSVVHAGHYRIQVLYENGRVDSDDVTISESSTSARVNFGFVEKRITLRYRAARGSQPALLVIGVRPYRLSGYSDRSGAIDALGALPGVGPQLRAWLDEARALLHTYRRHPFFFAHSEAARRVDADIASFVARYDSARMTPPHILLGSERVFVATAAGLAETVNRGITWRPVGSLTGIAVGSVSSVSSRGREVLAATTNGLSLSTDGGASWITYTIANGFPSNRVRAAVAVGRTIYAATARGLSVSFDNGSSWRTYTTRSGLPSEAVNDVSVNGSTVYAATPRGLSVSRNRGESWLRVTAATGLAANNVSSIFVRGLSVFAATSGGLSISRDGGRTWRSFTTANGLGSDAVNTVYASGGIIYAATDRGLSVSRDGGASWITYTTRNGLRSNRVLGVFELDGTLYAATAGGLSASLDSGRTWKTYTSANGLPSNEVTGISIP